MVQVVVVVIVTQEDGANVPQLFNADSRSFAFRESIEIRGIGRALSVEGRVS